MLIHALGITDLIVVVNKMDAVRFDEHRFRSVKLAIEEHLKKIGFAMDNVRFVPASGLLGNFFYVPKYLFYVPKYFFYMYVPKYLF